MRAPNSNTQSLNILLMKKTLLSSILALFCADAAMATTYTTTTPTGDATTNGNYTGFNFIIDSSSYDANTGIITTGDGEALTADMTLNLTSIEIYRGTYHANDQFNSSTTSLVIVDASGNTLGVSTTLTLDASLNVIPGTDVSTQGLMTYSFTGLEITSDTEYTAYFTNSYTVADFETGIAFDISTDTANVRSAMTTAINDWEIINLSSASLNAATITTESIPEPTTASLSFLALAGLMIRRRRKA